MTIVLKNILSLKSMKIFLHRLCVLICKYNDRVVFEAKYQITLMSSIFCNKIKKKERANDNK